MLVEKYRGYNIWKEATTRLYVSGIGISIHKYWYNIEKCKEYIDYILKFKIGDELRG